MLAVAGVIGTLARNAVVTLDLPSPLVAALAFAALVLAWNGLRTWLPPAGAVVLLAFLVPWQNPWIYGMEVALGAAVWVTAALVLIGIRPTHADKDKGTLSRTPEEDAEGAKA